MLGMTTAPAPDGRTVEDWIALLTQGSLASVIALVGVFGALEISRRVERGRERREVEREQAAEQRQIEREEQRERDALIREAVREFDRVRGESAAEVPDNFKDLERWIFARRDLLLKIMLVCDARHEGMKACLDEVTDDLFDFNEDTDRDALLELVRLIRGMHVALDLWLTEGLGPAGLAIAERRLRVSRARRSERSAE